MGSIGPSELVIIAVISMLGLGLPLVAGLLAGYAFGKARGLKEGLAQGRKPRGE